MPLANYSVTLNTVVSLAGGTITQGYAVTINSNLTGYVVADTANRAAVGGAVYGIALANGYAGGTVPIVASGYVPPEAVGTLGGSGDWVEVTSTGALTRASSAGADTIGRYMPDGGVVVELTLQVGGAVTGNATAIQGVSVTSASAARSYILAGNGTALRSRKDVYNFRDWGPDETGVTSCTDLLRQALAEIPNYGTLYIPLPSNTYRLEIGASGAASTTWPIRYWDDLTGGQKRGVHIIGEGPPAFNGSSYHFTVYATRPSGTTAKCTARTNGGSGDNHQTWELADTNIKAADVARWRGCFLRTYNAADNNNNGHHIIVDVPSDGVVRVSNINASPTGTENGIGGSSGSPTVCWWIDEDVLDIRAKDVTLENLAFSLGANAKIGSLLSFNHAPGQTAASVYRNRVIGCTFTNDTGNSVSQYAVDWVRLARNIVPTHSGNFAWRGTNGLGEYQYGFPPQVDTVVFDKCRFSYAQRSGAALYSTTAQAKENRFVECQFSASIAKPTQFGICSPRENTSSTAAGNPHFDVYNCGFGYIRDAAIQLGGYGSKGFTIQGCYSELSARLLSARTNTSTVPIAIRDCTFAFSSTYIHKSGAWIDTLGSGPLVISGGYYTFGSDTVPWHIRCSASSVNLVNTVAIEDANFQGTSTSAVRISFRSCANRGPYKFAGTEKLGFIVNGAPQVDITFSQANFNTACGYTVNLNEIHTWEVAALINYYVSGSAAWGDGDDVAVHVMSATQTTGGTIQVQPPASGTDANTQLGFPTTSTGHLSQSRLGKDSSGLVEWSTGAGTTGKTHIKVNAHLINNSSVSGTYVNVDKVINGTAGQGETRLEGIQGLSKTNGVPPKNFWTQVTHTGGSGATFTWTFANAEEDTNYSVIAIPIAETGGPAAGARVVTAITKNVGSAVFTATDPGGVATVTWHLELRR